MGLDRARGAGQSSHRRSSRAVQMMNNEENTRRFKLAAELVADAMEGRSVGVNKCVRCCVRCTWFYVCSNVTQVVSDLHDACRHKAEHNEGLRRVVNHPVYRNALLTALAALLGLAAFEGAAFAETMPCVSFR